jgi:hypothetical protein
MTATIVSAADAGYFDLLQGLVSSVRDKPEGRNFAVSILDVGLEETQRQQLADQGCTVVQPGWDFDVPRSMNAPPHFRSLLARPFLPKYFPGHEIYLHIDSDAWVQNWAAVEWYLNAAKSNQLAITPQIDRSYNTNYKRPRPYRRTQHYRSFKWSYGWHTADRLGRNPILNCGAFALTADAPHWEMWGGAIRSALARRSILPRQGWPHLHFKLIEQTAMNYIVFGQNAPSTFLPATCNWFCALATPKLNSATGNLVEPNAPHQTLGIVHLAGEDFQNRPFTLERLDGGKVESRLRYEDLQNLRVKPHIPRKN